MTDLSSFVEFMGSFFGTVFRFLSGITFSVFGIEVNYAAIIFAVIVIGFIVNNFYKGAKS